MAILGLPLIGFQDIDTSITKGEKFSTRQRPVFAAQRNQIFTTGIEHDFMPST
jgi:hypothetical protein